MSLCRAGSWRVIQLCRRESTLPQPLRHCVARLHATSLLMAHVPPARGGMPPQRYRAWRWRIAPSAKPARTLSTLRTFCLGPTREMWNLCTLVCWPGGQSRAALWNRSARLRCRHCRRRHPHHRRRRRRLRRLRHHRRQVRVVQCPSPSRRARRSALREKATAAPGTPHLPPCGCWVAAAGSSCATVVGPPTAHLSVRPTANAKRRALATGSSSSRARSTADGRKLGSQLLPLELVAKAAMRPAAAPTSR